VARNARTIAERSGLPVEVLLDLMFAQCRVSSEGDEQNGYRVWIHGLPDVNGSLAKTCIVVRQEDRYRVLATEDLLFPAGAEAMRRLEQGDLDGARLLLGWISEMAQAPGGGDPLAGEPFARIWPGAATGDVDRLRTAAASLMVRGRLASEAVNPLLRGLETAGSDLERLGIQTALAMAYFQMERFEDAHELAKEMVRAHPDSTAGLELETGCLIRLGRPEEAERAAQRMLGRIPGNPDAIRILAQTASAREDWAGAAGYYGQLIDSGRAQSSDYNNLAWNALFAGEVTEAAIGYARQAVTLDKRESHYSLHTLATLLAETGRLTEAREAILQAIEISGKEEPASEDWYVLGRIAEHFDLKQAAADAYRRVKPPPSPQRDPQSTYRLAEKRLGLLGMTRP
jgi:tetratricopeptide (TPR) repeat protein